MDAMNADAFAARSVDRSAIIGGDASAANTYADLYAAIADQRRRIAFFEPVVFHAHSIDSHDWAQRPNADPDRND